MNFDAFQMEVNMTARNLDMELEMMGGGGGEEELEFALAASPIRIYEGKRRQKCSCNLSMRK